MGIRRPEHAANRTEAIAREEQHLFADRLAMRKKKPTVIVPRPPPAKFPTSEAERLKRLRPASAETHRIFMQRLQQLRAFSNMALRQPVVES